MRPLFTLLALALFATPVFAEPPRTVTPSDVLSPICLGFAPDDNAIYAVRTKSTCDPATNRCEVASYLTRATQGGTGKTVGYLALARKDGASPSPDEVRATANPSSLAKANEAMADATVPCATANIGDTLTLAGGRTVKVLRGEEGLVLLRGDNFKEFTIPLRHQQLFWGPSVKTWYLRRDVPTVGGQDSELVQLGVSLLFDPPPPLASSQALALTPQNAITPRCLGAHRESGRYWFNQVVVGPDSVLFQLTEVGPNRTLHYDIARKPRSPLAPDPKLAALVLTPKELAYANARLSTIDAPCAVVVPPLLGAPPLVLQAAVDGVTVELSTVDGPRGRQLRFRGPLGGRRHLPADRPLIVHSAKGSNSLVVQSLGPTAGFEAVDLEPLTHEPRRFPTPAALPACLMMPDEHVLAVERQSDHASLVLRSLRNPAHPVEVLAKGAADSTQQALLESLTPERLIDLAERLPPIRQTPCTMTRLEAEASFALPESLAPRHLGYQPTGSPLQAKLAPVGSGLELRALDYRLPVTLPHAPGWLLSTDTSATLVEMDGADTLRSQPIRGWELAPQAPEVALASPKLLDTTTPSPRPFDRRCLAWDSKNRVAWLVRWQPACEGYECGDVALLTEVRSDGYYQRVTLHKEDRDWTNMFGHANTHLQKADLGCYAGLEFEAAGRPIKVSTDPTFILVEAGGKVKKVGKRLDDEGRIADLRTAFYHPAINAIAIELVAEGWPRYLWVDLSKI